MPGWSRFDNELRYHAGWFSRLNERFQGKFLQLLLEVHSTFPNQGSVPSLRRLSQLWDIRPFRAKEALAAFEKAGLVSTTDGVTRLAKEFRAMSGESSWQRTRRWREGKSPTARPPLAHPTGGPTPGTNDLQEPRDGVTTEEEALILDLQYSTSGTLNGECGNRPQAGVARLNPDEFDSELQSLEKPTMAVVGKERSAEISGDGEFELTPPTAPGGRNGSNGSHDGARALFALWRSLPGLEKHRDIQAHMAALNSGIKRFGYSGVYTAITRYSEIMSGDPDIYWQWSFALRDLITRKGGVYIERLISPEYKQHWANKNRKADTLDSHYKSLLHGAAQKPE